MRGFTLIEILIVLAIFAILSVFLIAPFVLLNKSQALSGSTLIVKSALSEARSRTISSENGDRYGVYFPVGEDEIVIFKGSNYSEGNGDNITIKLHRYVNIHDVNLSGGTEVVFDRISGATSQPGQIVLVEDNSYATTTVFSTGIVE